MKLPIKFKIANQTYNVLLVDHIDDSGFGEFDSVKAEIRIAKRVKSAYDGEYYDLSEEQILNSFWHEVFHCFNWHWNTDSDEGLAQSFANFMREYITSKEYDPS